MIQIREAPASILLTPYKPTAPTPAARIAELAGSMQEVGQLNPIHVVPRGDKLVVVDGYDTLDANALLGRDMVPVIVHREGETTATEKLIRLALNLSRKQMNPMEASRLIGEYQKETGLTSKAIAKQIGRSEATVSRYLALLGAPPEVQAMVESGELHESTANEIIRKGTAAEQVQRAKDAVGAKLTRAQVMAGKVKGASRAGGRKRVNLTVMPGWSLAVVGRSVTMQGIADVLTKAAERARLAVESKLSLPEWLASMKRAKPLTGGAA